VQGRAPDSQGALLAVAGMHSQGNFTHPRYTRGHGGGGGGGGAAPTIASSHQPSQLSTSATVSGRLWASERAAEIRAPPDAADAAAQQQGGGSDSGSDGTTTAIAAATAHSVVMQPPPEYRAPTRRQTDQLANPAQSGDDSGEWVVVRQHSREEQRWVVVAAAAQPLQPLPQPGDDGATAAAAAARQLPPPPAGHGESKRLVVESPWSQFTSECQRFGHPPRLDKPAAVRTADIYLGGGAPAPTAADARRLAGLLDAGLFAAGDLEPACLSLKWPHACAKGESQHPLPTVEPACFALMIANLGSR
jgi:hypothetical protein